MTLVTLRGLGFSYGEPLFSNLDFTLSKGDRVGVVAANGRGKSTLLRCIADTAEPTSGDVLLARGLTIGCVEQHLPSSLAELTFRQAVLDAMNAADAESESWRVDVLLETLEVPEPFRDRKLSELSGGWQRLVLLARAAVNDPDVLLLDEPTNHLDLARIDRLETWLNALPRDTALLVSSHDRAFLDTVTNRTLFIRPDRSESFSLSYSQAKAALDDMDQFEEKRFQEDLKTARKLRHQAAKLKNIGINSGSDLLLTKTRQLKQRAEDLEEAARPAHRERSAGRIRLGNRGSHASVLLTLDGLEIVAPDGNPLFTTGLLRVHRGDRIALMGPNGCGKSQFLSRVQKALSDPETIFPGIKATPSLALGYLDQALVGIPDATSPHSIICDHFDIGDQRARSLLAGAGIAIDRQSGPSGRLSGGQKARLAMLVLHLSFPNFYLLDEPTNHLDIEGQLALESELKVHEATSLFVSHDRTFIRSVATRFWRVDNGRLRECEDSESFFEAAIEDGGGA
ncbi:ABC-F family ATP-binding cassette domain-containing protein [Nisaea sediminum]|uniref:ABC-F family ATP-binding cassette domain-containing protein n=1 Tax=Nisaea sediminum TaxID=2775867 RepID=UPI0018670CF5|nr:ABC-F family ATP-binding cassette domain-containing protein [Nisaea sediminum]